MPGALVRGGSVAAALAGAALLLMLAAASPPGAVAAECDNLAIAGAGPSVWKLDPDEGGFEDANLFSRTLRAYRGDALDDWGSLEVDGNDYDNDDGRCARTNGGHGFAEPPDTIGSLAVRNKVYADPRRPFARSYFSLKNTSVAPVEVDLELIGDFGSDNVTEVVATSSGDGVVTGADSWATSCEDNQGDGCTNVAGERVRDPEIAQNWERPGADDSAESIDFADGDGGVTVNFDDVVVQPGKTVAFMSVVTLALDIKAARKAAARAASHPADAGVFRGLTKREKKRLVNW